MRFQTVYWGIQILWQLIPTTNYNIYIFAAFDHSLYLFIFIFFPYLVTNSLCTKIMPGGSFLWCGVV